MAFIVAQWLWLFLNVPKIVGYDQEFLKVGKIFVKVFTKICAAKLKFM